MRGDLHSTSTCLQDSRQSDFNFNMSCSTRWECNSGEKEEVGFAQNLVCCTRLDSWSWALLVPSPSRTKLSHENGLFMWIFHNYLNLDQRSVPEYSQQCSFFAHFPSAPFSPISQNAPHNHPFHFLLTKLASRWTLYWNSGTRVITLGVFGFCVLSVFGFCVLSVFESVRGKRVAVILGTNLHLHQS